MPSIFKKKSKFFQLWKQRFYAFYRLIFNNSLYLMMLVFRIFKKDPIKRLERKFQKIFSEAISLKKSGDIKGYRSKANEADRISEQIDELARQTR